MAIQAQMYSENLGFPLGGGGGGQDWIDNGCGLVDYSFNLQNHQNQQQQQQRQQLQQQQQQMQKYLQYVQLEEKERNQKLFHNNPSFSQSMFASMEMEKQKQEIDTFISLQNERLRLGLMQQRKQQLQSILKKCEAKAQIMLSQKDEEIAKAINRTIEIEDFLRRVEIESQTWQRVANENEAMVVQLNNTIEHMKQQQQRQQHQNNCLSNNNNNGVEDAESCCETGENRVVGVCLEEEDEGRKKMGCKNCNSGNSCVILLLPCRHLCACKDCEVFLDSCPVCKMVRKSSIEVLL